MKQLVPVTLLFLLDTMASSEVMIIRQYVKHVRNRRRYRIMEQ